MTVREIYEKTRAKGERYLDCPVLLCLPPNTTLDTNTYYEIRASKIGGEDDVGDDYVLVMPELE